MRLLFQTFFMDQWSCALKCAFHAPSSTASSLVITNSLRSALFSSLHQLLAVSFHVFCYDHFISSFIFPPSIKIYIVFHLSYIVGIFNKFSLIQTMTLSDILSPAIKGKQLVIFFYTDQFTIGIHFI